MKDYKFWGNCHQVALVLHKLTKYPLVILYGQRDIEDDEVECDEIMIHCGILVDGQLVDEIGFNGTPESQLDHYIDINEEYSHTEVIICSDIDEFAEISNSCGCQNDLSMVEIEKFLKSQEWFKEIYPNK